MYRSGGDRTCQGAAAKLVARYLQFLENNFKQYLITCLSGVNHVWELKASISHIYSTIRLSYIIGYIPLGYGR
jgi:hypothetical protein